ncbi:MAG: 7-cyano-7-deazaguanine synthase [Nitrospira sp.]|nr:7-cyano-7-deazaguanine synthase [Nitrospira sp.]
MKKINSQIAVLISGGLDSCVLLSDLYQKYTKVYLLYVKNGLLWEGVELYWLRRFLKEIARDKDSLQKITILTLPMRDLYHGHWSLTGRHVPDYRSGDPSVYLPGRNLLLLTKATLFCAMNGIGTLALGPLKGNPFPDSSKTFFQSFEKAASLGLDFPISIITPYRNRSKEDVIRQGRSLPLELTFSCIRPIDRYHCGICNKCAERQKAFKNTGIPDKTTYKNRWSQRD